MWIVHGDGCWEAGASGSYAPKLELGRQRAGFDYLVPKLQLLSGSQAPAWEPTCEAPASIQGKEPGYVQNVNWVCEESSGNRLQLNPGSCSKRLNQLTLLFLREKWRV